jgi:hypothetical protein
MSDDDLQTEDPAPASPAESLRLIEAQRAATQRSLSPDPRLIYWPWGIAWFVGFGLLYLRFGPHDTVTVGMPSWLPLTSLLVLMAVAFIVSGIAGARSGRQISGDSSRRGLFYGLAWLAGFSMFAPLAAKISDLLPAADSGLLWAAGSVGVVATMYLAGSAVWLDRSMFVLGVWLAVVNVAGILAGPGWHSLVICLGGGLGLVAVGLAEYIRPRHALGGRRA